MTAFRASHAREGGCPEEGLGSGAARQRVEPARVHQGHSTGGLP